MASENGSALGVQLVVGQRAGDARLLGTARWLAADDWIDTKESAWLSAIRRNL
jgi:hypothetical protein